MIKDFCKAAKSKNSFWLFLASMAVAVCFYFLIIMALSFAVAMTFGEYCYLLVTITFVIHFICVFVLKKEALCFKNIMLFAAIPALNILFFLNLYLLILTGLVVLVYCFCISKNINFKKAYIFNLLFIVLYFVVLIFGLVLSYFLGFSKMCGYLYKNRLTLNNDFEIVNVLYDCGATTSYWNMVYILPKGDGLSEFQKLNKRHLAFSAYRCYFEDLELKVLDKNKIKIKTKCKEKLFHKSLVNGVTVVL